MKATNYGSIIVEGKQPKSWKTSSIMNDNNNRILKWLLTNLSLEAKIFQLLVNIRINPFVMVSTSLCKTQYVEHPHTQMCVNKWCAHAFQTSKKDGWMPQISVR